MTPDIKNALDASIFTVKLTADEFAVLALLMEHSASPMAKQIYAKFIEAGIDRVNEIESETILDTDLFFAPEPKR